MNICPCGSGKLFKACCGPVIDGTTAPPTAEALMRSRYSAYALGNLAYIERTCAGPAARTFNRLEAEQSAAGTEWLGLDISSREHGLEDDDTGKVGFTFRFRQHGQTIAASELSTFRRIDGRWFYYDREDKPSAKGVNAAGPGRNDPCPCGSGKKFKKCHGA